MPVFTLTALDVTGIQRYIFGSNRLQENIGASDLVHQATRQWAFEKLPPSHNVADLEKGTLTTSRIEDGELAAEVVYAGGGNTLILFADDADKRKAKNFVNALSKKLLEDAPGLDLVAAHVTVDWEAQSLGNRRDGRVQAVMSELARVKQSRRSSAPVLGLGVTAACQSTGLVAVQSHPDDEYPISAEVVAKLAGVSVVNERLLGILPQIRSSGYKPALDFDDLGRTKGESSYIAVIHADGNRMGQHVQKIADKYPDPGAGNRDYIEAIRKFSENIEVASRNALGVTVDNLLGNLPMLSAKGALSISDDKFPFRPLVFGGDDVTFVCDGRLGLTMAARYLEMFEVEMEKVGEKVFACAGVAIVKAHYPFARAYQLAEKLCHSAKHYVRENESNGDFSALDWHFAAGGLLGSLAQIREREYEILRDNKDNKPYKLYMRPIRLHPAGNDWRTWDNFSSVTNTFNTANDDKQNWSGKRNKIMGLRQVLRDGSEAVELFRRAYDIKPLPAMRTQRGHPPDSLSIGGWDGTVCGYFDPIEAMDFFISLDWQEESD